MQMQQRQGFVQQRNLTLWSVCFLFAVSERQRSKARSPVNRMESLTTDFDLPLQCGAPRGRLLGSHDFLVRLSSCDRVLTTEAAFFAKFGHIIQNDLVVAVSLLPAPPAECERSVIRHPIGFPRRETTLKLSILTGRAVIRERNAVSGVSRVAEKSDPCRRTDPNMHSLGLEQVYSEVSQGVGFYPRLSFRAAPGCKSGEPTRSAVTS
jgi:hypothetical protein